MASNSIFDSFATYSSAFLRGDRGRRRCSRRSQGWGRDGGKEGKSGPASPAPSWIHHAGA
uniref:Uncharacterized protein n=1 Tax=Buteo japonicus TaxID=224669 RepID=A0A8B9YYY2_9AVES